MGLDSVSNGKNSDELTTKIQREEPNVRYLITWMLIGFVLGVLTTLPVVLLYQITDKHESKIAHLEEITQVLKPAK